MSVRARTRLPARGRNARRAARRVRSVRRRRLVIAGVLAAGIVLGVTLLLWRMDVAETFSLYVCGMLLGGTYEFLGTWIGEWTYVTHEIPPLWIVPLWGLACVAMVKLARLLPFLWRTRQMPARWLRATILTLLLI